MEERIFEARLRLLLRQWPVVWGGNLAVVAVCALVLWPWHEPARVLAWAGANYLLFGYRLLMRSRFEAAVAGGSLRHWAHDYAWSGLVGGLIWGSGAWLFFDAALAAPTLFLLVAMIGVSAGALPALSSYSPAYIAFAGGMLLPMTARLWTLEWAHADWLAALTLIFLIVNCSYSRNLDRTIARAITADLRNRELLEEVIRERDRAEQANRLKSRFLAAVSHDLRQPLHAMGLFMEPLGRHLRRSRERALYDDICTARQALEEMFGALLEISRLESGKVQPIPSHFRLQPLVSDVLAGFSEQARHKGLSLESRVQEVVVHSDPVLLSGILRNLLSNAIKYTDEGRVWVEGQPAGEEVELRVCDTGKGIATGDQERIFDEYQQLENPQRDQGGGLGLGLAMVRRTAELLGHRLSLESSPGRGSTFTLRLPAGEPGRIEQTAPAGEGRSLSGVHVLVIDDDERVRRATTTLLRGWDCQVTTGPSATAVLEALGAVERPPDLLICDYRLEQGVTGIEALGQVRRALDPELPALLVSGDTDPALRERITGEGFYLLSKPIKPAHLKHIMAELLA